jgi:phenylpropionate dioxygenase-like ring-hydroxylating dioxygenase large terminal subunit
MLTAEQNEFLTNTDPGTPMGNLWRRFWLPALLSEELPAPDCPPVRVRLLGEDLVAFRDTNGDVGLMDAHCPHRLADLFFGRNEECGLRCVYHGWKFDVNGECVDMPNEPAESNFKSKIRTTAYACNEQGGIIWAYMGPKELTPAMPELEWARVPDSHRYISKYLIQCNSVQATEGDIDNSHISFLHSYVNVADRARQIRYQSGSQIAAYQMAQKSPRFTIKSTDYGIMIGASRNASEDSLYWHITHWLIPGYALVGATEPGGTSLCNARVPIDNENSWFFRIRWNADRPISEDEIAEYRFGGVAHAEVIPGTFMPKANKSNDFLIDRALQRSFNYTGIKGNVAQDGAVTTSMGAVVDRSKEHLGTSDSAIIAMRRKLQKAARDLMDGIEPLPAHDGTVYKVRPAGIILPRDVPFDEGARDRIKATV